LDPAHYKCRDCAMQLRSQVSGAAAAARQVSSGPQRPQLI
jgi:hypothetical protein